MRYAATFGDPEVLTPLQLPWPHSIDSEGELVNGIAVWDVAMFGVDFVNESAKFWGASYKSPPLPPLGCVAVCVVSLTH